MSNNNVHEYWFDIYRYNLHKSNDYVINIIVESYNVSSYDSMGILIDNNSALYFIHDEIDKTDLKVFILRSILR